MTGVRGDDPILRLAAALARGEVGAELARIRPPKGERQSAVLALLTQEHILLHQRLATMRAHAGQVAFPGGGIDPGETVVEAALREAREETGLDPSLVTVLGQMPRTNIPVSRNDVTVVVGWTDERMATHAADPTEVAGVGWVRIEDLVQPANRFLARHPRGTVGPAFEVPVEGSRRRVFVWGFTAFVLDALLRAGGWERPWDRAVQREIPASVLGR